MSIKNYDFIIGYENKVREIESVCLVKYLLEKQGYSVMIFQEFDQRYDDVYDVLFHAKVLIVSAGYNDRYIESFIRRFITFDKLINWQWEQVFEKNLEDDSNSFINVHGNICRQAVQIAWGEKNIERNVKLMGLPSRSVIKTGPISMDFYNPIFAGLFKSREEILSEFKIDKSYRVAILIGSFAYAFKSEAQLLEISGGNGVDLQEISHTNLKRFIIEMDWIRKVLNENPDLYFVYRPHPDEEYDRCPDNIKSILDNITNETGRFLITQKYTVRQWFKVSDLVYTGYSTTMADAFFAQKNCVLLSPEGIESADEVLLFENAVETKSYEDFSASINDPICGNPLNKDMIEAYFTTDLSLKYPKVVNAFIKVLKDDSYIIDTSKLREKIQLASDRELAEKSLFKRLKLKLWRYDWFYWAYWKIVSLPIKTQYFKRQQAYKSRIDTYRGNYIASNEELSEITGNLKKCLEDS